MAEDVAIHNFDIYGKFHYHLNEYDYRTYIAGVRSCEKRRCKMEASKSACGGIWCRTPCSDCDRCLFDIRNTGWIRAMIQGQTDIGQPPRWLIPSLRATSPDPVIAGAINSRTVQGFISDVGICEPWLSDQYTADQWHTVPDFWRDESPITHIYVDANLELQVTANANIRCILHSPDSLQIAIITRAAYKYTRDPHLSRMISDMRDGVPSLAQTLRYSAGHTDDNCAVQCPCFQHRCFHCLNHYKYIHTCPDCQLERAKLASVRTRNIAKLTELRDAHMTIWGSYSYIALPRCAMDSGELTLWALRVSVAPPTVDDTFINEALADGGSLHGAGDSKLPIDDFASHTVGKYTWTTD